MSQLDCLMLWLLPLMVQRHWNVRSATIVFCSQLLLTAYRRPIIHAHPHMQETCITATVAMGLGEGIILSRFYWSSYSHFLPLIDDGCESEIKLAEKQRMVQTPFNSSHLQTWQRINPSSPGETGWSRAQTPLWA